jgi:hypothetical protein
MGPNYFGRNGISLNRSLGPLMRLEALIGTKSQLNQSSQMIICILKKSYWYVFEGLGMETFMSIRYFKTIWCILCPFCISPFGVVRPFGVFYVPFVYTNTYIPFWYIVVRKIWQPRAPLPILVYCSNKNLATPSSTPHFGIL